MWLSCIIHGLNKISNMSCRRSATILHQLVGMASMPHTWTWRCLYWRGTPVCRPNFLSDTWKLGECYPKQIRENSWFLFQMYKSLHVSKSLALTSKGNRNTNRQVERIQTGLFYICFLYHIIIIYPNHSKSCRNPTARNQGTKIQAYLSQVMQAISQCLWPCESQRSGLVSLERAIQKWDNTFYL